MRLGMVPAVVNRNPRFDPADWELDAGIEELAEVAGAAERLGYEFICFPGHVAIPTEVARVRGGVYWDQLSTMGFLAARTERIKLASYCVVLGYYHPLQIAKSYGTLDRISGGRLILGVGVGSLREEFELLGRPFEERGARADDAIRALRASLSTREPEYHGEYFDFADWILEPHAVQARVPIWVAGRSMRSLRRALELGDGWIPFGMTLEELMPMLDRRREEIARRGPGFDVVLAPEPPLDPVGDREGSLRAVERYAAAGATALTVRVRHDSLPHYLEQLEALAAIATDAGG
ncbi:MAG: LLM class F420-dependent oxidoreductase [Actinomycetota bacterium]